MHTEKRRSVNIFVLAMLCLAVVVSLRNLPLTAEYGFSALFFYAAAAVCFMVPYAFVAAELASGWPKGGGIYIWVREALGERWGFFAIWMQWFHNMTWYPAMLAFAGAGIANFFDPALAQNKHYLLSVVVIGFWGITFFNFLGVRTSTLFSTLCVIIGAILPGLLLIFLGAKWVLTGQMLALSFSFSDLLPSFSDKGDLVFLAGIFLALSGLEANANLARDIKNPQKNYPKAILVAAILTLFLLIFGSFAISIVIPKAQISLVSGLFDAFRTFFNAYGLGWLVPVIIVFTILGALGELNAWTLAGVKGLFATTEHGVLPPFFHKVNRAFVPTRLLLFQAIIVTIAALIILYLPNINISYWVLSALSAQMYILMYILLFLSGLVLRYKKPHVHRIYQVPGKKVGIWIVCLIGMSSALFVLLVSFLPPTEFEIGNLTIYEGILIACILVSFMIPHVIFGLRKPHWKAEVLKEIRSDIHQSVH